MKLSPNKLITIFLIISVLAVSIPIYKANAHFYIVYALVAAVVASAVVYDYVSCNFNVLWGGCGDGKELNS